MRQPQASGLLVGGLYPPAGRRTPTRASLGTASLSISSLFVISSVPKPESPVTLPPGRARLVTKPESTGSAAFAITMGMAVVAFFAANASSVPTVTIKSTLRRTKSAASSRWRSGPLFSANRYSKVIFFPSIHSSLFSLPERVHEDRATRGSARIQVTYAEDFSGLLCICRRPKSKEHDAKRASKDF